MSNFKREIENINIPKEIHARAKLGVKQAKAEVGVKTVMIQRLTLSAAALLLGVSVVSFTPVGAAIKEAYDKIFMSDKIDDPGLKSALNQGHGQAITQTYYDEKNDITVYFENVMTDNKETKLLVTYESETTNLKEYYLDIFEGVTSMFIVTEDGNRKELDNVGWGSRHYDKEENKVSYALSFESIKEYEGQTIRLEIEDITAYVEVEVNGYRAEETDEGIKEVPATWKETRLQAVETIWPVTFTLDKSSIMDGEVVELNKEFTFQNETYNIERVEYSELETRLIIKGSDMIYTDEDGNQYPTKSKLELHFLNPREINSGSGYTIDESKSGVFLNASGEQIIPNFSKGEVDSELGTFIMVFAPVKDRSNVVLEVGEDIKIPLSK